MDTATSAEAPAARPAWVSWSILCVGVVAASVSAILIRYATGAAPLAISFWRCAAGATFLFPFARFFERGATRTELRLSAVAGTFLALHFGTWITSLELTTVAESVLLVSMTPVFVALVARWLWRERLATVGWAGIGVAIAGSALIGAAGQAGESSLGGNALALAGGAAGAGYFLAGTAVRRTLPIIEYSVVAYATAAALLLLACLASGTDLWGYAGDTWWAIAGLVAGPQLLGHTLINLTLSDIDATTVTVTMLAEPVIATALAFTLFSEAPSALVYPGGVAILFGIYLVTKVRRQPGVIVE